MIVVREEDGECIGALLIAEIATKVGLLGLKDFVKHLRLAGGLRTIGPGALEPDVLGSSNARHSVAARIDQVGHGG